MKSVFDKSFNVFMIIIFLAIEIIGFAGSYLSYKNTENKIQIYYSAKENKADEKKAILEFNKNDFIVKSSIFFIIILLAAILSNFVYLRRITKIRNQFKEYEKMLISAIKNHEQLILDNKEFYAEFKNVTDVLNTTLGHIYSTNNFNALTKIPKKDRFINETLELAENSEVPIIVTYIYLKNYQNLLKSESFMLADKIIIDLANRFVSLAATIEDSKIAKINGNGDFLLSFPCIGTVEKTFEDTAMQLHKCFNEIIDFENDGLYEQEISIGYDIANNKDDLEIVENAYRAALLASTQKDKLYYNYSHELEQQIELEKQIENDLRIALDNNELYLSYQAKIYAKDDRVSGAEALVRWSINNQIQNTQRFIKIAETSDLIIKLEKFVIEKVFSDLQMLQNKNMAIPISINISSKHLQYSDIANFLMANCRKYIISPSLINIEISERQKFNENCEKTLKDLKALGFSISIDDFGKDYSSLSHIANLPIDIIKIDKSFIDSLSNSNATIKEKSINIIKNIIKVAKDFNKKTIAEGVETSEQVEILKNLGCDELQGFYYKNPVKIDEFIESYKTKFATK